MSIVYPPNLPQRFLKSSIKVTPKPNVIQQNMAVGPHKRRPRDVVEIFEVSGTMVMTVEEFELFEVFYNDSLGKTAEFNWTHPIILNRPMLCYYDHSKTPYEPGPFDNMGARLTVNMNLVMRNA